jgi:hypothetical protein
MQRLTLTELHQCSKFPFDCSADCSVWNKTIQIVFHFLPESMSNDWKFSVHLKIVIDQAIAKCRFL